MLARGGELPTGEGWAFEVKWDGFRAVVSTEDNLRVRSRRGWEMSDRLPELAELPGDLVLDGEVVAFNEEGVPHFPNIVARVLHGEGSIRVVSGVARYRPISAWKAGSSRIGSKSESSFAITRTWSDRSIARPRCSIASAGRPARLSQHATL
jgi:hypothetical protein